MGKFFQESKSCSPVSIMKCKFSRLRKACLLSRTHLLDFTNMNTTRISNTAKPNGLLNSSGFAGLSSNRLGHQAFNLIIRVRAPLTLLCFLLLSCLPAWIAGSLYSGITNSLLAEDTGNLLAVNAGRLLGRIASSSLVMARSDLFAVLCGDRNCNTVLDSSICDPGPAREHGKKLSTAKPGDCSHRKKLLF